MHKHSLYQDFLQFFSVYRYNLIFVHIIKIATPAFVTRVVIKMKILMRLRLVVTHCVTEFSSVSSFPSVSCLLCLTWHGNTTEKKEHIDTTILHYAVVVTALVFIKIQTAAGVRRSGRQRDGNSRLYKRLYRIV